MLVERHFLPNRCSFQDSVWAMTLTHGICHSKGFGPKRIIQKRFLSIQNNLVHTMTARPINEDSYMHEWRTRIRTCNANDIVMWEDAKPKGHEESDFGGSPSPLPLPRAWKPFQPCSVAVALTTIGLGPILQPKLCFLCN